MSARWRQEPGLFGAVDRPSGLAPRVAAQGEARTAATLFDVGEAGDLAGQAVAFEVSGADETSRPAEESARSGETPDGDETT